MKTTCRLCKEVINNKGLSKHLLGKHNTQFKDYVEKYFDDFPNYKKCPICGKTTKGTACSMKCINEWKSIHYTGRKHHAFTEEEKLKISKARKKQGNPWQFGRKFTEESKELMRQSALKRAQHPDYKNPMYGKTHTPETVMKIFSFRRMNKLEKRVADVLDKNNIKYTFQFFINENDIIKSYDFKIKGKPIIIEIDGDYWHGGPGVNKYHNDVKKTKRNDILKEKIANNRGYTLHRFWESEIKNNIAKVLEIL